MEISIADQFMRKAPHAKFIAALNRIEDHFQTYGLPNRNRLCLSRVNPHQNTCLQIWTLAGASRPISLGTAL